MEAEATSREAEESGRRKCPRDHPRVEEKSHSQETREPDMKLHNFMCATTQQAILSYVIILIIILKCISSKQFNFNT